MPSRIARRPSVLWGFEEDDGGFAGEDADG